MLLPISLLRLTNHIELFLVIEEDPLALQALNVDFEYGGAADVRAVLDQDLEEDFLGLTLQELVVSSSEY